MFIRYLFAAVLVCLVPLLSAKAETPKYLGRTTSTAADTQAILQVTQDFQKALVNKDALSLSGLLLHSKILFSTPLSPERLKQRQGSVDTHADGVDVAGAIGFLNFIANSKSKLEERFHNIRITQDQHLAWVMFDFEFLEDGKVENHGLEVWQMVKTVDQRWKILSVVWSSRGAPK